MFLVLHSEKFMCVFFLVYQKSKMAGQTFNMWPGKVSSMKIMLWIMQVTLMSILVSYPPVISEKNIERSK
jgi:hypothetical protein